MLPQFESFVPCSRSCLSGSSCCAARRTLNKDEFISGGRERGGPDAPCGKDRRIFQPRVRLLALVAEMGRRVFRKSWILAIAMGATALAGTFGTRIQIGGEAADLALDEPRGVLYVADFTRNRIEIVSLAANAVVNSIAVDPNPSSLSISPNGLWLLVSHFGNNTLPAPPDNLVTLIDLANPYTLQKFRLNDPPVGVAFGKDNLALIVTTKQFFLFDPLHGFAGILATISDISAKALPAPADSFPADITSASIATSADGSRIYGMGKTK